MQTDALWFKILYVAEYSQFIYPSPAPHSKKKIIFKDQIHTKYGSEDLRYCVANVWRLEIGQFFMLFMV